jgi:hypothetical protein
LYPDPPQEPEARETLGQLLVFRKKQEPGVADGHLMRQRKVLDTEVNRPVERFSRQTVKSLRGELLVIQAVAAG